MVVRRLALALSISVLCGACSDDACTQIAAQLRQCCNEGPPELRGSCIDQAEALEDDGNTEACERDLERGAFARCEQ